MFFVALETVHYISKTLDVYSNPHLTATVAAASLQPLVRSSIVKTEGLYELKHSLTHMRAVKYCLNLFWVAMAIESYINF